MNKNIIAVIFVVIIVAVLIMTIIVCKNPKVVNKEEYNPEEIFEEYVKNINNKDYEAMYEMLDEESKNNISKDEFIARNKNIYEGIDVSNLKIEIINREQLENSIEKFNFLTNMDSIGGKINFENTVELKKDEEKGYLVKWNSNLIFPSLNNDDKVKIKTISATRGEIIDKNGVMLAGEGEIYSVGIVPGKLLEDSTSDIKKISELLNIDENTINKYLSASWVKEDSFVPIKKVSKEATTLKEELLKISGVKITTVVSRIYPFGESCAHLIGYMQNITKEELEANPEKGYTATSLIGKAGLEKKYEERLKGTDGVEIYIEDSNGNKKVTIAKKEVVNGENIKLTIDSNLQEKLYNTMKNDAGLFVAMNPSSGEILALVSTPSYNPNNFLLGLSNEEWNNIKNDENTPMIARYLKSYCPGSTFKPVIGAVALTTNSISADDEFKYTGLSWQKDSSWGDYNITTLTRYNGAKNLKNALIHSDNIFFAQVALKIGKNNLTSMLDKMKFNENIEFTFGVSKSQYSNSDTISSETLLADTGYGQGQVLVNPIHMASIYSAFVNDGDMVKPYLEYNENNKIEYLVEGAFSKEAANIIKEYLIEVVENPEGTANDMKINGITIAGKTGTAELKTTKNEDGETLGWFDCFTVNDEEKDSLLIIGMVEDASENGGSHYLIKKIKSILS